MKKKLAACITISLVMCLTMVFPASAVQYKPELNNELWNCFNISQSNAPLQIPSEYCYTLAVVTGSNYDKFNGIYYMNSPDFKVGTKYYQCDKYGNFSSGPSTITSFDWVNSKYFKLNIKTSTGATSQRINDYSCFILELSTAQFPDQAAKNAARMTAFGEDWWISIGDDPFTITTTALESLLSQAKAIQEDGYRKSTYSNLQNAISSAENLLNTTGYTQEQIDTEVNSLQAAVNGLQLLPDASHLESLVVEAEQITDTGYTAPTWSSFTTNRTSSRTLLNGLDYTTPQVDTSYNNLSTSMTNLTLASISTPDPPHPTSGRYIVPYDTSLWQKWWYAVMKTIGSASSIGMLVFIAVICIGLFKIVLRFWF